MSERCKGGVSTARSVWQHTVYLSDGEIDGLRFGDAPLLPASLRAIMPTVAAAATTTTNSVTASPTTPASRSNVHMLTLAAVLLLLLQLLLLLLQQLLLLAFACHG